VVLEAMPKWLMIAWSGTLGLIVGSFLNVVIVRLPAQQSLVRPRSRCPKCKAGIPWWGNIPILSFLLQRGKCRSCKKSISPRYPLVEALTALLFIAAFLQFGLSAGLVFRVWPFIALLISITFIDIDLRIIPDQLSLGGLILGLGTCWMDLYRSWDESLKGAALGFGLFYGLAWFYQKLRGQSGLGGGDIKLLAMIGAFLGPNGVFFTIIVSSLFGSVFGLSWALLQKEKDMMKVAIPFGPFLVVGAVAYCFLFDSLWHLYMTQI
jgi:leader peptidase (prepilin peptidase)/N-methyltransferase